MLQIAVLRDQPERVLAGLAKKHYATAEADVQAILELDQRRRQLQTRHDEAKAKGNELARLIGPLMKKKNTAALDLPIQDENALEKFQADAIALKQTVADAAAELAQTELEQQQLLLRLPNLPHESVPQGRRAEDNEVVRQVGEQPTLPAGAQPH